VVLREELTLNRTEIRACGAGPCVACMVHIDGERTFSLSLP